MAYTPVAQRKTNIPRNSGGYIPVAEREEKPKLPTLANLPPLLGTDIGGFGGATTEAVASPRTEALAAITPFGILQGLAKQGFEAQDKLIDIQKKLSVGVFDPEIGRKLLAKEELTEEEKIKVEQAPFVSFDVGALTKIGPRVAKILDKAVKSKAPQKIINKIIKFSEETIDNLTKKFGDDVAEQVILTGDRKLANRAIKLGQSVLDEAGIKPKPKYIPVTERLGKEVGEVITPKIAPELEPLVQEARKFKSAEEFVKEQKLLYHGTSKESAEAIQKAGGFNEETARVSRDLTGREVDPKSPISLTLDRKIAELYIDPRPLGEKGALVSFSSKGLKLASETDIERLGLSELRFSDSKKFIQELKKNGFDGYHTSSPQDELVETIVFNKEKLKLTSESQLTDFYNQAVRGVEKIPPTKRPPTPRELGIVPPAAKKITRAEDVLLRERLRAEARGAKVGFKVGKAEARETILTKLRNATEATDDIRKDITDFVKANLDPKDRGKAIVLVRDAKTQRNLVKAFARVNRWAEEAIKKATRDEVIKLKNKILDSPSIAIDYKARVKELLGDFELKGHREETLERLKKTQEFLKAEAVKGRDVEMPRRILKALSILDRQPFDEITLSQLQGLQSELELLEELGRAKFRTRESLLEIQKTKILDEVRVQGARPVEQAELIRPEIGERLTITQKLRNLWIRITNQAARIDKAISPMDTIFDLLDGGRGTYDGANFRFFKSRVDADYGKYITRKNALQEPVIELVTKNNLDAGNLERIGMVAAREQDGGIEKLIATGFNMEEINAVKLTKEEQEVLDLMRKTFDSQFPEIQEVMRTVYNQPVEKVKNYFSFMTDWKAMDDAEVFQRFGSQVPEQFGTPRKNVEVGFTKSRVGGEQKIKINAMEVFMQHTDNTSYLLEVGETSKTLGEVAATAEYAELVGGVGQLMVREWIDVVARKGGAAGASQIAILDTLRKNVGAGILGLKLSTIAIQPTALIDGMGFIGVKYGMKGANNFVTDSAWRKFIGGMPEISDRLGGEFALRELTGDNWLQKVQKIGFIPMQTLDQITAGAIAGGAYERKMIELGRAIDLTKGYDSEALAYAQLAVRRTQSSGSFKDVPLAISRGTLTGNRSLDRAILQFQNFLLTRWSRIRHDAIRAGINTKDPKKAIPVFTAIIFAGLAGAGIRLGVNKIQDFVTGREDKDTIAEDLQKSFFYEMAGNVPFMGTALSMAMYDGEMFPILDAPKGIVSGLNRIITSKSEGAKLRGFAEFAGSTGAILGIPGAAQAEQLLRGALQEEKKEKRPTLKSLPGLPALPGLPKLPSLPGLPALR